MQYVCNLWKYVSTWRFSILNRTETSCKHNTNILSSCKLKAVTRRFIISTLSRNWQLKPDSNYLDVSAQLVSHLHGSVADKRTSVWCWMVVSAVSHLFNLSEKWQFQMHIVIVEINLHTNWRAVCEPEHVSGTTSSRAIIHEIKACAADLVWPLGAHCGDHRQ